MLFACRIFEVVVFAHQDVCELLAVMIFDPAENIRRMGLQYIPVPDPSLMVVVVNERKIGVAH